MSPAPEQRSGGLPFVKMSAAGNDFVVVEAGHLPQPPEPPDLVRRICRRVSELTGRRWVLLDAATEVRRINRLLMGWSNYFCLGPVSKAHRGVDAHAQHRLRQWLRAKHKVRGQGFARFPDRVLYQDLGLIRVQGRPRIYPWANA